MLALFGQSKCFFSPNMLMSLVIDRCTFTMRPYQQATGLSIASGAAVGKLYLRDSTFLGRAGLYLEDLYVQPQMRGRGIGKQMLSYLAQLALSRGCGRLEWWVLDWNKPALRFYRSLGATPMDEWTVQRVSGEALQQLAKAFDKDCSS